MARQPVLARADEAGDRFYTWKGEAFWSVTTLIGGGVPKYGIAPWSAKVVAELVAADIRAHGPHARAHAAVRRWSRLGRADVVRRQAAGELTSIKLEKLSDLELALRWLKGEPDRVRDAAGEIGSDVHSEAEAHVLRLARDTAAAALEGEALPVWPEHLLDHMRSFETFLAEWSPTYEATEASVFNRPQAYAGTLDAIVRIRAGLLLEATARVGDPVPTWLIHRDPADELVGVLDYKAGRAVYPEVGLQLAAYSRAEFVGLPDGVTEAPLPAIDFGAVLHITPRGYRFRLVRIDDAVFNAFLFAREVYRFRKEIAGDVLGHDLAPVPEKAAA
ncbi:MAG TPA: hypothetical protein VFI34_07725 [Candidatus Limnocylindrales bacterium]|nr:hypothetical protein [Candidatus Limnocylindrales bacterium]